MPGGGSGWWGRPKKSWKGEPKVPGTEEPRREALGQSVVVFLADKKMHVYDTCYTSLAAEHTLQNCWRRHGKHCRAKIVTAGQAVRLLTQTNS